MISTFAFLPRIPLFPHFHKRPINLDEVRNTNDHRDQDRLRRISRHAHAIDFEGPQAPTRIRARLHLEEKRFDVLTAARRNKDVRLDRIKKKVKRNSRTPCVKSPIHLGASSRKFRKVIFSFSSCGSFSANASNICGLRTWTIIVRLVSTPLSLFSVGPQRRKSSSIMKS